MKKTLFCAFLSVFFLPLAGGLPAKNLAAADQAPAFLLSNGMRVIEKNDSSSPLVALQLWVQAGAADESPEEAGLAHLLEHVLFRGSAQGTAKPASEVEQLGGQINGFTARDHTVYYMVLPSARAKTGLRLLAQLMQLRPPGETAYPQLEREIQVVLEEWKQAQDNPGSLATNNLFETAYPAHPYGRPILGNPETLGHITWDALGSFYRRWYVASNMTLVIVGKLPADLTKGDFEGLFASLPVGQPPARHRPFEIAQGKPRFHLLKAPVRQAHLMIAFPIPAAGDPAEPALDLLAFILGRGENSRLAQTVKITGGLVNSISSSLFIARDPGLFLIQAQLEPDKTMAALQAVFTELHRLRQEPASPSELKRAHVNFSRASVETNETVEGQAGRMGKLQSLYGDPYYDAAYLEKIRRLDEDKLTSTARAFFKGEGFSVSLLVPETAAGLPGADEIAALGRLLQDDRSQSPAREGGLLSTTLENGLRIRIQEDHRLPIFTAHAGMIGGVLLEDETDNGIHGLIAGMLTQGSAHFTSSQLIQEVEQMGGNLHAASGNSALTVTGTFPSSETERGLEIFLEVLLQPAFPEQELEKKKQEALTGIKNRGERARSRVYRLFYQTLFRNHPYRLDPLGEREAILRSSREELAAEYHGLLSPERLVLSIAGDVNGEKVLQFLRGRLSALPRGGSPFSQPPAENEIDDTRVAKATTKANQAHIIVGFPAPAKGDPGYFTMKIIETILSRIGGRLFVTLRDQQGLAYSVGAFCLEEPFQGAFGIYAATDPARVGKMTEGILKEIRRLGEEEVGPQEIERAKNSLIANYWIGHQTNAAKAADLTFNELFGLGADFSRRYQDEVEKVSAADILRFARRYLSPDRYVLAVLGP